MENRHRIGQVQKGSIAQELDIQCGDYLLAVNGHPIEDVFDYQYYTNEEELLVLIEKADGEQWELQIEKEFEEDLGLEFDQGLMDEYRSCRNNCVFCFIDQMPPGMRDTLYFKDDDSRLSFLQGNYVTLTNMSEHDLSRIVKYHLEPINISIHATNPDLRCKLLHNRFAGDILDKMQILYDGGIHMNGQIVLCKGLNDGAELERSFSDMEAFMPLLQSVSIVPVGVTKFREGLEPLETFGQDEAREFLAIIDRWQKHFYETYGSRVIQASDEWYILAGYEMPKEEHYEGYLQLENGVGMVRLLQDEFAKALADARNQSVEDTKTETTKTEKITMITGTLVYPTIQELVDDFCRQYPQKEVQVISIVNHYFGEQITVTGLITGTDIIDQLKDLDLGDRLLIPCSMLRYEEDVFLDDITMQELSDQLNIQLTVVGNSGQNMLDAMIGEV